MHVSLPLTFAQHFSLGFPEMTPEDKTKRRFIFGHLHVLLHIGLGDSFASLFIVKLVITVTIEAFKGRVYDKFAQKYP